MQVREKDLSVVISTLEEEFNIYREVEGESVPVHCQDLSNGLQKNGKEGAVCYRIFNLNLLPADQASRLIMEQ